jgi:hypothetical protein
MTSTELRTHLLELESERALAHLSGVGTIGLYMDDLEREIDRSRMAFVGVAVTEVATLRAQLSGPQVG